MEHVQHSLHRVLKLLRHEWVHSFCFPQDSRVYLDQLHYALAQPYEDACAEFSLTTSSGDELSSPLALDERLSILFIPSFTTGNITVGFEICERRKKSPSLITPDRYVSRTVRDDDNGIILGFSEFPHLNLIEVSYCIQSSPCQREHVFLLLRSKPFLKAMSNIQAYFDQEAISKSLVYSFYSVEMRKCPKCAAETPAACLCGVPVKRKRHPLDYDTEKQNMMQFVGAYDGLANLNVYDKGRNMYKGNFTSSTNIQEANDAQWTRNLSLWAIRDAAQARPLNIVKMNMPNAPSRAVSVDMLVDGVSNAPVRMEDSSNRTLTVPSHRRTESSDLWSMSTTALLEAAPAATSVVDSANSAATPMQLTEASITSVERSATVSTADVTDVNGRRSVSSQLSQPPVSMPVNNQAQQQLHADMPLHPSKPAETNTRYVRADMNTNLSRAMPRSLSARQPLAPCSSPDDTSGPSDSDSMQHDQSTWTSSAGGSKLLVPLAPARVTPGIAGGRVVLVDERMRKLELRKARNRASAHRSNHRKKVAIQKLKEDLETATRREAFLRKRERELREENLRLRSTIAVSR